MPRLFVALRPPPPIRAHLLGLMAGVPGARWQDDAQLHLTLRFIGDVDVRMAEEVVFALSRLRAQPIEARLAGVGAFARGARVHTLWAGVAPLEPIGHLHRKIDRALVQLGLEPVPRVFAPHITVARLSLMAGAAPATALWQQDHAMLASAPFAFTHLALYESDLRPGGAEYREVETWQMRN